jgi:hypothetical protein
MGRTTMHDALLIYWMIANMRHAGYFRSATHVLQSAKAKWALLFSMVRDSFCGSACTRIRSGTEMNLALGRDWVQALTRLESYIASMS